MAIESIRSKIVNANDENPRYGAPAVGVPCVKTQANADHKHNDCFDATCGYPGEGPPAKRAVYKPKAKPQKCTHCGRIGHTVDKCTRRAQPRTICTVCNKPGHLANVCRFANRPVNINALQGISAAQALARIAEHDGDEKHELEHKGQPICTVCTKPGHLANVCRFADRPGGGDGPPPPPGGDDGPPPPPPPDQPHAGGGGGPGRPQPKQEKTPAEKEADRVADRAAIIADMKSKATTLLMTRDLENRDDFLVTMRGIAAICRNDKLHRVLDPGERVDHVMAEVMSECLENVLRTRRRLTLLNTHDTYTEYSYKEWLHSYLTGAEYHLNSEIKYRESFDTPITGLKFFEAQQPKSIVVDTTGVAGPFWLRRLTQPHNVPVIATKLALTPIVEEAAKRLVKWRIGLALTKAAACIIGAHIVRSNPPPPPFVPRKMGIFEAILHTMFETYLDRRGKRAVEYGPKDCMTPHERGLEIKKASAAAAAAPAILFMSAAFAGVCLTAYEVYRLKQQRKVSKTETALRTIAHTALATLGPVEAVATHVLWNAACMYTGSEASLNSMASGIRSASTPIKHPFMGFPTMKKEPNVILDMCCAEHGLKTVNTQASFEVNWADPHCEPKFGSRMSFGVKDVVPTVFRSCDHNEKISLCGRVGKALPCDNPGSGLDPIHEWGLLTEAVLPHMVKHVKAVRRPMNFEKWLVGMPPSKRELFRRLKRENSDIKKRASSFIKREKALRSIDVAKISDPRMIQGCDPNLSIKAGPTMRVFAKNLREGLKPRHFDPGQVRAGRQVVYTCGQTSQQIGKAFSDAIDTITSMCDVGESVVIVEDDQSRFDLHLRGGAFHFLHKLYSVKLPNKVAKALTRGGVQNPQRGRTALGTRYSIPFTMQSGWPDTSAGDTALNAGMKFYVHGIGNKWITIICGDDSVTVTTDKEIASLGGEQAIIDVYTKLGMEVTLSTTTNPELVGFCSGRFMRVGESYLLVPKTGKMLARLGWDMTDRNASNQQSWLRGIRATLQELGKNDTVLQAMADRIHTSVGNGRIIREAHNPHKIQYQTTLNATNSEMLNYYNTHYGLSARDVERICEHIRSHPLGMMTHPLIVQMAEQDV